MEKLTSVYNYNNDEEFLDNLKNLIDLTKKEL
jgi:hypothetical protein